MAVAVVGSVATTYATTRAGFGRWVAEQRHARRAAMVEEWRRDLIGGWGWRPNGLPNLVGKPAYASLAPRLPADLRAQIEGTDERGRHRPRTVWLRNDGDETLRLAVSAEIARIEEKWRLV